MFLSAVSIPLAVTSQKLIILSKYKGNYNVFIL
jgi:hypothetical protein